MVDIAVCNRRDCPKKDRCFRYLAQRDEYRQSQLDIDKLNLKNGCEYYWRCRNMAELHYMNKVNR